MISQKGATATSDAATPMSLSFIMPAPTSHTTTPQLREGEPAQNWTRQIPTYSRPLHLGTRSPSCSHWCCRPKLISLEIASSPCSLILFIFRFSEPGSFG